MVKLLLGSLLLVAATAGSALADMLPTPQMVSGHQYFAIDWQLVQRNGAQVVTGHVHNIGGTTAARVTVLVEHLDATGRLIGSTIGHVSHPVFDEMVGFEVSVADEAASYRVSIFEYEWLNRNLSVQDDGEDCPGA